MKVEVDVLGSPSLIVLTVSVDVKSNTVYFIKRSERRSCVKVEVDDLGAPNSPYVLCGRKETLNWNSSKLSELRSCVKVEVDVLGFPSLIIHNYGLCGRKATLNSNPSKLSEQH